MWITPCGAVHTWGMRFPVDVLFLDSECRLLGARAVLRPWRIALAPAGTRSVLELPARRAAAVRPGDRLQFEPA
jgi:uncharacterized membrane protein (UPF0127 family)